MSGPPPVNHPAFEQRGGAVATVPDVDPDRPPWGIPSAVFVWLISMAFLLFIPVVFIVVYALSRNVKYANAREFLQGLVELSTTDPNGIFVQIFSVLPAHLLTFGVVWAVVTRFGRRPFWRSVGWGWGKRFGFWKSVGLAVGLLGVGLVITYLIGGEPTDIDRLLKSSNATRWMLAIVAAGTAPLIEELVYRGVIYSAFHKTVGMFWAVMIVSFLFAGVHVLQYYKNLGVVLVICILSVSLTLARALTGKLLPGVVMHFVFNGLQSLYIVLEPYLPHEGPGQQQQAVVLMIGRTLRSIF